MTEAQKRIPPAHAQAVKVAGGGVWEMVTDKDDTLRFTYIAKDNFQKHYNDDCVSAFSEALERVDGAKFALVVIPVHKMQDDGSMLVWWKIHPVVLKGALDE